MCEGIFISMRVKVISSNKNLTEQSKKRIDNSRNIIMAATL